MKIVWTTRAINRLRAIRDYHAEFSDRRAGELIDAFFTAVDNLTRYPRMGKSIPHQSDPDNRFLLVDKRYLLIYRLHSAQVALSIVNIVDTRQRPDPSLFTPLDPEEQ